MQNAWRIYLLGIISFVVSTSQFVIVGVLDKIAASLGVSLSTAGQLVSAFSFTNALLAPPVMMLVSKLPRNRQLLVGMGLVVLGIFLTIPAISFDTMLAGRAFMGIGNGVFISTAYLLAVKMAGPGERGKAMSYVSMGYSAALVFGIPLGRFIAAAYDWLMIFNILGVCGVIAMLVIVKTLPAIPGDKAATLKEQIELFSKPSIIVALSMIMLLYAGYSTMNTYITPLLQSMMPMSDALLSGILSAFGVAALCGSKLGGLLIDHFGVPKTFYGTMIATAGLTVILIGAFYLPWVAVVLFWFWVMMAWSFGLVQTLYTARLSPEAAGIILSFNSASLQFGFAAGATVGGFVLNWGTVYDTIWMGAVVCGIACLIALVARPLYKNYN